MASPVAVTSFWMTYVVMTLLITSPVTTSASWAGGAGHDGRDEGVCWTRYLSSANGSDEAGSDDVVGMAAILELRRPNGGECGAVNAMELQTVAALFWAVNRLNGHTPSPGLGSYIPGIRLELRVYDDCSHDVLAARHVGQLLASHPDYNCTPASPPLAGILGTTTSHTTSFVAGLLSSTQIPHFGTSATVSVLSNNVTYPTFFRTVPSDLTQSKVLVDLVQRLQWTYVVGIYTRDNYGTDGYQEFKRLATQIGVCVFKEKSFWHTDPDVENSMERWGFLKFVRELLIELRNTRFSSLGVVYFGHDTEAFLLFKMIKDRRSRWHDQEKVNRLFWLVSDGVGTSLTIASLTTPYTLLSISPATDHLDDIDDFFFHALDHPEELGPYWQTLVREYLQEVQDCFEEHAPVSSCQLRDKIEVFSYLPAALDSFYSLAALLDRAHHKACGRGAGGGGDPGLCQNMLGALKGGLLSVVQPEAMNYSLHFSPERLPSHFRQGRMLVPDQFGDFLPASSPLYFISLASNGQWTKIGEYGNGSLQFRDEASDLAHIPRSECGTDCQQCRRQADDLRYAYHPGDVLLLGLYSISSPPTDSASFACGDYRRQSSSVAALLAFLHAIRTLSPSAGAGGDGTVAAGGGGGGGGRRRFGALVLDDCYNKLTASALLADLFSGKTTLRDPLTGEIVDMSKVVAVIGSQSSSVTLSALSLLTPLRIPAISYSATSPDLDDRLSYPYFLRPVPSDSLQARALVDLVRLLNITYVGALHQNNNYGWRGIQTFVAMAQEVGICVESPVPVNNGDSEVDLHQTLRDIRNKDARVVVVFLVEPTVLKLLDAIHGKNLDLIFLASEAWTLSSDTLQNHRGMTARGSLVLTVDTSREAGNIKMADYLGDLTTPELATHELPWMRDFWENEKQCNLPGGFTNSYDAMCDPDVKLSQEVASALAGDQKVVQTINAVASVTTALQQQCGQGSDPAACILALPAQQAADLVRLVWLQDQRGQAFRPYLANGNGNVGFTLHNIQKTSAGTYRYVQVGRYVPDQGLQMQEDIVFYDLIGQPLTEPISSTCKYKVLCQSVCGRGSESTSTPPVTSTGPGGQGEEDGKRKGLIVAVVVLALLCGLLLAVLQFMVCCAKCRGRIPGLGVVRKNDGASVSQQTSRLSVLGGRTADEGEINVGFSPTSSRVSLPLPPIPGSRDEMNSDQYNDPSIMSSRVSSPSAAFSSHMVTSPGPYGDRSHYDYSEDEGFQRKPQRHQFHSQYHQDLRRQIQDPGNQRELPHRPPSSPSPEGVASGKDRQRARSVPRVIRPDFLPLQGQRASTSADAGVMSAQDGGHFQGRPRSHSHDAFRTRLGALSDDDQQLLLKYLQTAHQRSFSPNTPQRPMTSLATLSELGGERPSFSLQSEQVGTPEVEPREVSSPPIVFENPPTFCPSGRMSASRQQDDNSSLLYLHAIPTEKEMYLELLPDPSEHPLPPSSHHSPSTVTSPQSSSPTTSAVSAPGYAPIFSFPAQRSPFRVSSSPAAREASPSPRTPASSSTMPVAASPQRPQTVMSPLPLVRGSTASESSGAVFVSPDQESSPFRYAVSPKSISPSEVLLSSSSAPSLQNFPTVSKQNGPTRDAQHVSSPMQQLVFPNSEALSKATAQGNAGTSPVSQHSTPQTSPQMAASFPGIFVRDRAGAVFWMPGEVVSPTQQSFEPGFPVPAGQVPPASVSPPGMRSMSPAQHPRSDLAQSPKIAGRPLTDLAQNGGQRGTPVLTRTSRQETSATLPSNYRQQLPATTYMQQTPVVSSPQTHGQETSVALSPTNGQQTSVAFALPSEHQTPTKPAVQARSKTPKMGVDSLSAPKRIEVVDQNHNTDTEVTRTAVPDSSFVSVIDVPTTSSWDGPTEHPGSPQRTQQASGPSSGMPPPLGEGASHSEGRQPVPTPSPCKPLSGPEVSGSGGSNHTSGDSGTGEDLNTDAYNMDSRIEVCV